MPNSMEDRLKRLEKLAELQVKALNQHEAAIEHLTARLKGLMYAYRAIAGVVDHEQLQIILKHTEKMARQINAPSEMIAVLKELQSPRSPSK